MPSKAAVGPVFVGRAAELEVLDAAVSDAAGGSAGCILLLADPGLGKTRLVAELLHRHRRRALGLTARAHPLGMSNSFMVWAEALERHLRTLGVAEVRDLCGGFVDDLAVLLHSVAAARGAAPDHEPPRGRVLEGLAMLTANLARTRPLTLFLDDVHDADDASWEALSYVLRALPDERLLVVIAARPAELGARAIAEDLVLALEQEGVLRRVTLQPLGTGELTELSCAMLDRASVPDTLVSWLAESSRGVPLFAVGLLRALIDEGGDVAAPHLRHVPEGLGDRVRARLRQLDEPTLATLETLAVVGRNVDHGDLVHLAARPGERLDGILERLVRAGLVAEEERGATLTYEIAHPLVQEVIYGGIGGARRRSMHRLVGRTLLRWERLSEAAPHFARSASAGDAEAVEVICCAIGQAEQRELHGEAIALLDLLVDVLPHGDERWLQVLDVMRWDAEWVFDHRADVAALSAIRAMREIDAVLEGSGDDERQAGVQLRLASFEAWGAGDIEAGERHARRAIELFDRAGRLDGRRIAEHELAWHAGLRGDPVSQESGARAVIVAAEAAGDRVMVMQALGSLMTALWYVGRMEEARAALLRSVEIAEEDGKLYRLSWNLSELAWVEADLGRIDEVPAILARGRAVNPGFRESLLLETSSFLAWMAGDLEAAIGFALETGAHNRAGLSLRRAWAMAIASRAAAEMGRFVDARRMLARADVYRGRPFVGLHSQVPWSAGVLARLEGRPREALAPLRAAADDYSDPLASVDAMFVLVDLVDAAAAAGEPMTARGAAEEMRRHVEHIDGTLCRPLADLGTATAALAAGDVATAALTARRAADGLGGYRLHRARALEVLGHALDIADRASAIDALEEAAALLATSGAMVRRDAVLAALSGMGHAGQRASATALGAGALTRRERQVGQLASSGLTSREIGDRLFIGERTVETHLARVYAKLGVASRLELVRRSTELGL